MDACVVEVCSFVCSCDSELLSAVAKAYITLAYSVVVLLHASLQSQLIGFARMTVQPVCESGRQGSPGIDRQGS
jgi:hypothetical protein